MLLEILYFTYIRMVIFLPFYSSAFIRIEIIIILFSYGKRLAVSIWRGKDPFTVGSLASPLPSSFSSHLILK